MNTTTNTVADAEINNLIATYGGEQRRFEARAASAPKAKPARAYWSNPKVRSEFAADLDRWEAEAAQERATRSANG